MWTKLISARWAKPEHDQPKPVETQATPGKAETHTTTSDTTHAQPATCRLWNKQDFTFHKLTARDATSVNGSS